MRGLRDLIRRILEGLRQPDPLFAAVARVQEHYEAAMAVPLHRERSDW